MKSIDIRSLKRNAKVIKTKIKQTKDTLVAMDDLYVLIPKRYFNVKLASMGEHINSMGVLAIVSGNQYAVLNILSKLKFNPSNFTDVIIDEVEYIKITYLKDEVMITDTTGIKVNSTKFNIDIKDIINEFYINGNVPWFLNYEDHGKILSTTKSHLGIKISDSVSTIELLTSVIARDPKNMVVNFRKFLGNDPNLLKSTRPAFTGIKSPYYANNNAMNKLLGAYKSGKLLSALVDEPSDQPSKIEQLLRQG